MKFIDRLKSKKGVSLIETVIAIAVLVILSAFVTTISVYSVGAEAKNARDMEIASESENVLECFEFSSDIDEMFSLLKKTDDEYVKSENTISLNKSNYGITIIVADDFSSISLNAVAKDGNVICQYEYEKRA